MRRKHFCITLGILLCLMLAVNVFAENGIKSFTITAGGDIILGGETVGNNPTLERFDTVFNTKGPSYFFEKLQPLFANDDITILNLEGPLMGTRPRHKGKQINYKGKPEYVKVFKAASIEVANVENNHIRDYGTKDDTIELLKDTGVYVSRAELDTSSAIMNVNGVRVGFVGYLIDAKAKVRPQMIKKMKQNCDVVICSFHFVCAKEYSHTINKLEKKAARAAINYGADIVLGHHTHEPQGIEMWKDRYIFYGLGATQGVGRNFLHPNFVFQQKFNMNTSTKEITVDEPVIYPIWTSGDDNENNMQPVLLDPSDPRYENVFNIIDRSSKKAQCMTAPYVRGTP